MGKLISDVYVPSSGKPSSDIWVIGESPGWEEERQLEPFIGPSGQVLREVMYRNGISPSDCYITNLCHYRPVGDKFQLLEGSSELARGLEEIDDALKEFHPKVIVLAGAQALKHLTGKIAITHWRGSILEIEKHDKKFKVIPTYHPSYVLPNKSPELWSVLDLDWARIKKESSTHEVNLPKRQFAIDPPDPFSYLPLIEKIGIVSCDIETVKNTTQIICIGFGVSPDLAIIIPWEKSYAFTFAESILSNPRIKKLFHNGVFDCTVLRLNGVRIEGFTDDTIIQAHVLNPELPRDLAFLTSIYTREPYYKTEGRSTIPSDTKGWSAKRDKKSLYVYNGKDCCVTFEIFEALNRELDAEGLRNVYAYEMELDEAIVELNLTGLKVDQDRMNLLRYSVTYERDMYQTMLNGLAGMKVNVRSTKALPKFLYETLGLPAKKNRNGKLTADQDALVKLIGHVQGRMEMLKTERKKKDWMVKKGILQLIIKIRETDKLLSSYLTITLHEGKAKSVHRVDGTDSGRLAAKKFVDNSGVNLQTIPRSKVEVNGEVEKRYRESHPNESNLPQ